jgi:transposase-like protein
MNKPLKRKTTGKYDAALKIAVAREYLTSELGYVALSKKYDIPDSTVRGFVKWYKEKYPDGVILPPEAMKTKLPEDQASLQITALQMLIENASKELGIDLVKKFGTKQPNK